MEEIIFVVEESDEGGYIAKGVGIAIFTEAETVNQLKEAVRDAVRCHFDDNNKRLIRLHWVNDEVFAA
jgi:hypothetical protein